MSVWGGHREEVVRSKLSCSLVCTERWSHVRLSMCLNRVRLLSVQTAEAGAQKAGSSRAWTWRRQRRRRRPCP